MLAIEVFDKLAIFRGRNLLDAVTWACGQEPFDAPVDLVGIGKMETRQGQILRDRLVGLERRVERIEGQARRRQADQDDPRGGRVGALGAGWAGAP